MKTKAPTELYKKPKRLKNDIIMNNGNCSYNQCLSKFVNEKRILTKTPRDIGGEIITIVEAYSYYWKCKDCGAMVTDNRQKFASYQSYMKSLSGKLTEWNE